VRPWPEPQSSKNLFDDSRRLGVYVPACLRLRKVSYGAAEHRCPPARRADEIDSRQVWKGEYADFTPWPQSSKASGSTICAAALSQTPGAVVFPSQW